MNIFRTLYLAHRYLGIGIGLMMAAWCVSGIIMMYAPYPEMDRQDQLRGLPELDFANCCKLPMASDLEGWTLERARIEMLADRPVLRTPYGYGADIVLDLSTGEFLDSFDLAQARAVAQSFINANGLETNIAAESQVDIDQWTVYGTYEVHRPLHHFALDDRAGREIYVSSTTGEVVQYTTQAQRFWNWIGTVTHWLYPVALRQRPELWSNIVIGLSLAGMFLTVIGLYLGIRQAGRGRGGALTPYRGWSKWHHYSGLFFGVLVLTWVASGFLSMNPGGLLAGNTARIDTYALRGAEIEWPEIRAITEQLSYGALPAGQVRLDIAPLAGRNWITSHRQDGLSERLDPGTLTVSPIGTKDWQGLPPLLAGNAPVRSAELIDAEDAYYYSHHDHKPLPVFRIILDDDERTRFYLDAVNGNLVMVINTDRRWYRWLFSALHRWDLPLIRIRPIWDIVMLVLMLGVTVGCVTGAYMGFRRLFR